MLLAIGAVLLTFNQSSSAATPVVVAGFRRLAWDQRAAAGTRLESMQYAIYIDGVRSKLDGAACDSSPAGGVFTCAAALPGLSPGAHTIELTTFVTLDTGPMESTRSSPLAVSVVATGSALSQAQSTSQSQSTTWSAPSATSGNAGGVAISANNAGSDTVITTTDQVKLSVGVVFDGLDRPTDLASTADGRFFIAEQAGRVRVSHGGQLQAQPALALDDVATTGGGGGGLLALALDPQFNSTHFVYVVYTTFGKSGETSFRLVRFREANDTLADRVILLDDIPASGLQPAASARFGPDGKLYAAFDDAGDAQLARDAGSYNGKILRLNPDGTTPSNQAGYTPVYVFDFQSPRGIDWQPGSGTLWVADGGSGATTRLAAVGATGGPLIRGTLLTSYALASVTATALTFYNRALIPAFRGNLLVADAGGDLLRIRFNSQDSSSILGTERLLQGSLGAVRFVTVPPDGSVYLGTANALVRVAPGS